ncbi:MAG: nucleoside hydrolase [Acidimicrobiia bacterium]|nr:nucleoside hydrolase [Acidimicrobiia bacterium]
MTGRRIIIDTDPGQDDALAIFLALASPEVEVESVVTVAGNVPQPLVTTNALRLLELADRTDVPVYRGADLPLIRRQYTAEYVHGDTGIDGVDLPPPVTTARIRHGVAHIVDTCLDADDASVTLCPIGPLTNIALAIATDRRIVPKIREIVWMGGALDEPPNTQGVAEFNAYVDPHAVAIVLASGAPITMFPLDVTHKAILEDRWLDTIRKVDRPVANACVGMSEFYARHDEDSYGFSGAVMHDPCVIAYLVDPTLFTGRRTTVSVEIADPTTQGRTYEDPDGADVSVMLDTDVERLMELFVTRWMSL